MRSWILLLVIGWRCVVAGAAPADAAVTERLIPGDHRTYGAISADMDRDGDQDLVLNLHGFGGSGLYLNDGTGRLTDSRRLFQPQPGARWRTDRHGCDVADVDRNGRLDVFCSTGGESKAKELPWQHNELLLQRTDGSFVQRAGDYGVTEPWTRGRDVAFVNIDGDRYPDLVTTSDPRSDGHRSETIVYQDGSGTRFVDRGPSGLPRFGPLRCLEPADWNRDGFTDLALCPLKGGVRLYEATRTGRFADVTAARRAGSTATVSWAVQFADLDGDGFEDMVRSNTSSVEVRRWNRSAGAFTAGQTIAQPDARRLAIAHYDGDANLDLYVLNRGCATCSRPTNPPDHIYRGRGDGRFTFLESTTAPGSGDFVTAWAPRRGALDHWMVGNGHGPVFGPVQVIRPS